MKKGFTLVELLAVILILGIIGTIITITLSTFIEKTRREAFKQSVIGILRSGEQYIANYNFKHPDNVAEYPIIFSCGNGSCLYNDDALAIHGMVPTSGRVAVESKTSVLANLLTDGRYCAYGYKHDLKIGRKCSDVSPDYDAIAEVYAAHYACTDGRTLNGENCQYYYASNAAQCGSSQVDCGCHDDYACYEVYCKQKPNGEFYDCYCTGERYEYLHTTCSKCTQANSCTKNENQYRIYACNEGDVLDGETCYHYTCPYGGILEGTTCVQE